MPLPSIEILSCLVNQCRRERDIVLASLLQTYMCKSGFSCHSSFKCTLIAMLVESGGSLSNIEQALCVLVAEKEWLVNSLIGDYAKHGELEHGIFLYQKSKQCVRLCSQTVVTLLKACIELEDVERGRELHADSARQELDMDLFVGSTLINFYAKCGFLEEAQEVFDRLRARDIVCWNALIAGYVKHGLGEKALYYAQRMQDQGISPNTVTYVCSLKACGSLGTSDKGQELHAEIARRALLKGHHFVGNALVDMYSKCGLLVQAEEVFSELSFQDFSSWIALVVGYANSGQIKAACRYLELMKSNGVSPNSVAFLAILKACTLRKATEWGLQLHAEIVRTGLLDKAAIGISLVEMYASSGWFEQAQEVLHEHCIQEVVAWTTLITHHVKYELCEEALECYKEMRQKGVSPNSITFICCLKACSNIQALDKGQEIHDEINQLKLLENNLAMGNALLDMYANCGCISKSQEVFDMLPNRDVVSWTALILGYIDNERGGEALKHFDQMKLEGIVPDAVTYACALKACASIGAAKKGLQIHDDISRKGLLEKDLVIANALIDMYASCGLLSKAWLVLNELAVQDAVSWTALIAGLVKYGFDEEALDCIDQMQQKGIILDDFALVYSLQVCGNVGAKGMGEELHMGVSSTPMSDCNLLVGNALIDMYAKCGFLSNAVEIFGALTSKDQASWNALITGYAQLGEIDSIIFYYNKLVTEGNKPNLITFVSILSACSHSGLIELADAVFKVMIEGSSIIPTLEHITCMIDLLGRAGQLGNMVARIRYIPFQPSLVMWHSLLGACRKWGNIELGRVALENAVQVERGDIGCFVSLSNIRAYCNDME